MRRKISSVMMHRDFDFPQKFSFFVLLDAGNSGDTHLPCTHGIHEGKNFFSIEGGPRATLPPFTPPLQPTWSLVTVVSSVSLLNSQARSAKSPRGKNSAQFCQFRLWNSWKIPVLVARRARRNPFPCFLSAPKLHSFELWRRSSAV